MTVATPQAALQAGQSAVAKLWIMVFCVTQAVLQSLTLV